MVFRRLWNFAQRHRRKILVSSVVTTGVVAGAAYWAWKVWLPRMQERMANQFIEAMAAEGKRGKRKSKFVHKQEVSDRIARSRLAVPDSDGRPALLMRHHGMFPIDDLQVKIREASAKGDKQAGLDMFMQMQVECFARLVSATYFLHLLMVLYRIEFTIVGRDQDACSTAQSTSVDRPAAETTAEAGENQEDELDTTYESFLKSARHLEERGIEDLASAARKAVASRAEAAGLLPKSPLTASELERFLLDVCGGMDAEFLGADGGAGGVAALLPDSLNDSTSTSANGKVQTLLNEARDVVESPQFREAVRTVVTAATKSLVGTLSADCGDAAGAPLREGQSCTLAKLFGPLMGLSNSVLSGDKESKFIVQFAEEPIVSELCEAIYFGDDVPDSGEGLDGDAGLASLLASLAGGEQK